MDFLLIPEYVRSNMEFAITRIYDFDSGIIFQNGHDVLDYMAGLHVFELNGQWCMPLSLTGCSADELQAMTESEIMRHSLELSDTYDRRLWLDSGHGLWCRIPLDGYTLNRLTRNNRVRFRIGHASMLVE